MESYDELKAAVDARQQQLVEANGNQRASALKGTERRHAPR